MKFNRAKKLFIFSAVCAMLLSYFVFFAVSPAYAAQPLSPEQQRLTKELEAAAENEKTTNKTSVGATQTQAEGSCWSWQVKCHITKALNAVVNFVLYLPLFISEYALDTMVAINLEGAAYRSGFVTIGWGISRDVANMFFIFFVLWLALATVFQFENYSAKRLLPKLIIVALLVNFSLPIGLFVINVSNAIAKVFYNTAKTTIVVIDGQPQPTGASLAQSISQIAQINDTKQAVEASRKNENIILTPQECDRRVKNFQGADFQSTRANIASAYNGCIRGGIKTDIETDEDGSFYYEMMAIFWKLVIGLVASFVFFAGAIFFLVRYLYLIILLIFGPLAFLFMILPATQEHWNKWWSKLTQWSFFAPAFMFMIMLSVRLSSTLLTFQVHASQSQIAEEDLPSLALQYVLVIGLFIASLFVAQSMGIAMSGTVVGWGRSMARGAGRYAKGASFRGAARAAGAYAQLALETPQAKRMAATPIVRGLLRPLEAAVGAKRGVEEERARKLAGAVQSGNPAYAAARLQGERASVQAAYLRSANAQDIQKLEKGMGANAMGGIMAQLRSIAPELGKKIGNSFKDIDLRVAATKDVAIGTPEFERAREEYISEQTPYALGQILTAENLQKEWVQKYLLARGGEKEINAITQSGEQIRALVSIFEGWADGEINNNTALGNEIRQNIAMGQQSFGYSAEQAKRETMINYLPELLEKQTQQMGIATNQALQSWAQAAPARVMLGEGRVIQRGTDMDELLRRLGGGGGGGGTASPQGGAATP